MLVRINRGPNFGQEHHMPVSQELNLAILLGDVIPVEQKPAAPPVDPTVVRFMVSRNANNDRPQLVMVQGAFVEAFQGTPDQLTNYGFGGRANRRPPVEISEQYRAAYESQTAADNARRRV